jgi:molybdate transport system ATP-binding protein
MAGSLAFEVEICYPEGAVISAAMQIEQAEGKVTVLFGPSGSGKSTLLRALAGLEQPRRGFIRFDSQQWFDSAARISLPPQKRRVGLLFQELALFPHLTVRRNIEYGLATPSSRQSKEWVKSLLSLCRLEGLEDRLPRQLSGGQKQRVALARTLAPAPQLLLLDEPLSALDTPTRQELREDLRAILNAIQVPVLLVTHDQTEAIALGDRVAIMLEGCVQQIGPVQEVFSRPANEKVAAAVGVETVFPCRIVEAKEGLLILEAGKARIYAVDCGLSVGMEMFLCVRGGEISIEKSDSSLPTSTRNHLAGKIISIRPEGSLVRVLLDCGLPLTALLTRRSCEELNLREDDRVLAAFKATSVHLIPHPGVLEKVIPE